MNNLQREIREIKEAEREKAEHKALVKKRALNMVMKRCARKIIDRLGNRTNEQ